MPHYKYSGPHEWLEDYLSRSPGALFAVAQDLASKLDGDTLQDMFQTEMEQDGYFVDLDAEKEKEEQLEQLLLGGPGHNGYTYNADVYCVDCGQEIIKSLFEGGKYKNGDSGDSNDFPQPIFFGESDQEEHCADCGEYLYGEDPEEEGSGEQE